jgi:hypothetical protein
MSTTRLRSACDNNDKTSNPPRVVEPSSEFESLREGSVKAGYWLNYLIYIFFLTLVFKKSGDLTQSTRG